MSKDNGCGCEGHEAKEENKVVVVDITMMQMMAAVAVDTTMIFH